MRAWSLTGSLIRGGGASPLSSRIQFIMIPPPLQSLTSKKNERSDPVDLVFSVLYLVITLVQLVLLLRLYKLNKSR